jgi:hypothetical protein
MAPSKSSNLSAARLAANRRNALKSTGPKTPAGKRRVSLNKGRDKELCSAEVERDLLARGESPRDFRRLHRDLIALFRPGDRLEKGGVQTLASVWWKKARRIRGWVGAGEPRCDDLDAQLDQLIRLLLLTQSAQHQWWKARISSVLGYGLRNPLEVRLRIERRLFAFGGRPGKRNYPRKPAWKEAVKPYEEALGQIMADVMAAMTGDRSQWPPTENPSQQDRGQHGWQPAEEPGAGQYGALGGRPMGVKPDQTQAG